MPDALTDLGRRLAERARERPLPFSDFMTAALYDPDGGYYARGVPIGAEGDFFTSASLPGFAESLAAGVRDMWARLGRPNPFTVVELGAGTGDLGAALAPLLADVGARYVTVEPNPGMARAQRERGLEVVDDLARLGRLEGAVVLANEVVDALPVHRVVKTTDGLGEMYVAYDDERGFFETPGPLTTPALEEHFAGVDLAVGQIAEANIVTGALARALARTVAEGYVVLIDYGDERPRIHAEERFGGTVRAFHGHRLVGDVFARVGEQDITASVDFTALRRDFEDAGFAVAGYATQGEFLVNLGIVDHQQALFATDPLAATKVKTLFVPGGMGDAFKVLVLARNAPTDGLAAFKPRLF